MGVFEEFRYKAKQSGAPATTGLVALVAVSFLLSWMVRGPFPQVLVFFPDQAPQHPWTLLTYPFAIDAGGFVNAAFSCLWLWSIGGSVERDLGSQRYVGFWLAASLLGSLAIWLGAMLARGNFAAFGGLIPISALTVVWGTRNASATVSLMFVLPVTGRWLAWISAAVVLFGVGAGNPMMGVLACIPLAAAYLFATDKIPGLSFRGGAPKRKGTDRQPRQDSQYYDEVRRREKTREERERLRKLFESSVSEDPEDGGDTGKAK